MIRSRLLWKFYAGYVLLILLTAGSVGALVSSQTKRQDLKDQREVLERNAKNWSRTLEPKLVRYLDGDSSHLADLQARVIEYGKLSNQRITVIDPEGRVLADSDGDPSTMDNHLSRPEVSLALVDKSSIGITTRHSDTLQAEYLYVAFAAYDEDNQHLGFIRTSLPMSQVSQRLAALTQKLIIAALVSALFALILGFLFAQRIVAPILKMTRVVQEMAAGNYRQRLAIASSDEIGELTEAVNLMARQLGDRVDTITRENNKLLAVLGGMVEGVVAVDCDEKVVLMNEVAARLLETPLDQYQHKRLWEVTRFREVADAVNQVLSTRHAVKSESRKFIRAEERVLELYAAPLVDGEGELAGAVVVLHDATELRRLGALRQEFVSNVSHELKTPITAIQGMIETLLEDPEMPQPLSQRFLERTRDQAARLAALVTDLLTLARLDDGEKQEYLEKHPLDVREPIEEAFRSLELEAEKGQVSLELSLPDEPVRVVADQEALRQVSSNLITNAIKYTPPGGDVWVRVFVDSGVAVIEVEDTGVGIEERDRARIFERFYRVDKARSREVGGTGLGLSIVKNLCLAHGGEVSVESTVGRGSVFRARFPLATQVIAHQSRLELG